MKISCIITTYKNLEFLPDTLRSIFMQDYPDIELIISDDCSDNFNQNEWEQFIEENKGDNITSYKILVNPMNVGTVKNINGAIKASTGEILTPIAGDDMFYESSTISKIVERFKQEKCEILTCSRMRYTSDMKEQMFVMPHPGYYETLASRDTAEKQFKEMALGRYLEFASGASLYYTSKFMKENGYYDERYCLWEDGPLLARSTRNGTRICSAYDIIAIKYRSGGISSKTKQSAPPKIQQDYVNLSTWEFKAYRKMFNYIQYKIILGRHIEIENFGYRSWKDYILYPEWKISNYLYVKRKTKLRERYNKSIRNN